MAIRAGENLDTQLLSGSSFSSTPNSEEGVVNQDQQEQAYAQNLRSEQAASGRSSKQASQLAERAASFAGFGGAADGLNAAQQGDFAGALGSLAKEGFKQEVRVVLWALVLAAAPIVLKIIILSGLVFLIIAGGLALREAGVLGAAQLLIGWLFP